VAGSTHIRHRCLYAPLCNCCRTEQGRARPGWAPASHRIYHGAAVDSAGQRLDEVLLLAMLSPRSYTREHVIELHTHGGGTCAARVLRACIEAGARPARPGEFTLRAFLNGRLDLSQAEAVAQLVAARPPAAADSALAGLTGGVGAAVGALRRRLLSLLAELEARLDFDEDMPPLDEGAIAASISGAHERACIVQHLNMCA
jgi:tRNA modification GTPase